MWSAGRSTRSGRASGAGGTGRHGDALGLDGRVGFVGFQRIRPPFIAPSTSWCTQAPPRALRPGHRRSDDVRPSPVVSAAGGAIEVAGASRGAVSCPGRRGRTGAAPGATGLERPLRYQLGATSPHGWADRFSLTASRGAGPCPRLTPGIDTVLHVHSGNLWGGVETMLLTLVKHSVGSPGWSRSLRSATKGA